MAPNNSSAQEQLTYCAILQIVLVVACALVYFYFIRPQLDTIDAQAAKTNAAIEKYQTTENDGISFSDLIPVVTRVGNNEPLLNVINANAEATKKAIAKDAPSGTTYVAWLDTELQNKKKYEQDLQDAKDRINTILPTLSPVSGGVNENNITLLDYVAFIETKIIKGFNLDSSSTLGINGIKYDDTLKSSSPIGSFDTTITFKGTNKNIINLLNYIYKSGNPSILTSTGEAIDYAALTASWKLSNPLMVVQSFSLTDSLNKYFPNLENSGQLTLRMYIRGASASDKEFLLNTFNQKKTDLTKQVTQAIEACKASTNGCMQLQQLESINAKLIEFSRSTGDDKTQWTGVDSIYYIGQQLQSLNSIQDEFNNINK